MSFVYNSDWSNTCHGFQQRKPSADPISDPKSVLLTIAHINPSKERMTPKSKCFLVSVTIHTPGKGWHPSLQHHLADHYSHGGKGRAEHGRALNTMDNQDFFTQAPYLSLSWRQPHAKIKTAPLAKFYSHYLNTALLKSGNQELNLVRIVHNDKSIFDDLLWGLFSLLTGKCSDTVYLIVIKTPLKLTVRRKEDISQKRKWSEEGRGF